MPGVSRGGAAAWEVTEPFAGYLCSDLFGFWHETLMGAHDGDDLDEEGMVIEAVAADLVRAATVGLHSPLRPVGDTRPFVLGQTVRQAIEDPFADLVEGLLVASGHEQDGVALEPVCVETQAALGGGPHRVLVLGPDVVVPFDGHLGAAVGSVGQPGLERFVGGDRDLIGFESPLLVAADVLAAHPEAVVGRLLLTNVEAGGTQLGGGGQDLVWLGVVGLLLLFLDLVLSLVPPFWFERGGAMCGGGVALTG